jgi:hypothetical protein
MDTAWWTQGIVPGRTPSKLVFDASVKHEHMLYRRMPMLRDHCPRLVAHQHNDEILARLSQQGLGINARI